MKVSAALIAALAAAASAAPATKDAVLHEKRQLHSSTRWAKRDAVNANTRLPVRIALKQRNLDKGMDYLMEVSDPNSPKYGKHYTQDQVVELFAPSDESIETVKKWLVSVGIPDKSIIVPKSKGWVAFESTAEQLESVFNAKYHVYQHARSDEHHVGTDEYHLPDEISKLVDFVHPGVAPLRTKNVKREDVTSPRPSKFKALDPTILQKYKADKDDLTICDYVMTPQCIKALYSIPKATGSNANNKMGIYESDGQTYSQEDLDAFYALAAPEIPKGTHPIGDTIGNVSASGPQNKAGGEAMLDYDMAYPIVYPQEIVDYQVEIYRNDLFDTFLDAIDGTFCDYSAYGQTGDDPEQDGDTSKLRKCGEYKPTNVISISYGLAESDYPVNYQKRQCDEYMKLGLQGTSIFLASGDYGVAEEPCLGPNEDIFVADSASACPYMTAVGSTELSAGKKIGDEEQATARFASGGGFSNIYPMPDYQRHAVNRYFISHDPGFKNYTTKDGVIPTTGGLYNGAGRGYPDISAVGDNGLVIVRGNIGRSGGTSMSAPILAAMFNLINEERIKKGKGPVGFINPTLYAHQQMFHDIVKGNQDGDAGDGTCMGKAFSAVRGWDPVTGMGTPKFDVMSKIFVDL